MSNNKTFSEGPWFVYLIFCEGGSLYTGIAKDPQKRFQMHLSKKGAKYTKINKPLYLIHIEEYENHSLAIKREIKIKTYPTLKKRLLINQLDKK